MESLFKQFIKHPALSSVYFIVNIYSRVKAIQTKRELNARWAIAITTKKLKIF